MPTESCVHTGELIVGERAPCFLGQAITGLGHLRWLEKRKKHNQNRDLSGICILNKLSTEDFSH